MSKVFNVQAKRNNNKKVNAFYNRAMEELKHFYEINWNENTPSILLVDSREEFDILVGKKTESWVVGTALGYNELLLLSPDSYEKESIHKYSDEEYFSLIKHELSHLFYTILSKGAPPVWLDEGFAIYSSGQLSTKKKPKELKHFLEYYSKVGEDVYSEAGFVVEALFKKYSKKKVLDFIKLLPKLNEEKVFKEAFEKYFKLDLTYERIGELL
jgi:hypothetical protein